MIHKTICTKLVLCLLLLSCKPQANNPQITIETELGNITLELYADKAPITVQNFLRYVNENRLDGTQFYRTVSKQPDNQPDKVIKIEVIQGGFAQHLTDTITNPRTLPPIAHETTDKTGVLHQDGTISMARDAPGTAQAEFFICIGNQPELDFGGKRNPDGQGFAAFGKVIKGMDIVKLIHRQPSTNQMLEPAIPIRRIKSEGK
jgi:peptidyl-prolyl cis-trans isomerase A (cyclophilin A)